MPKDLDKYFDDFFEVYKTLSLEELQKIAFNLTGNSSHHL